MLYQSEHTNKIDTSANIRRATQNELEQVLNRALENAGHAIPLRSLQMKENGDGSVYRHPNTGKVLIKCRLEEQTKIYTVYDADKHLASEVSAHTLELLDDEKTVAVVSGIKEFYPSTAEEAKAGMPGTIRREREFSAVTKLSEISGVWPKEAFLLENRIERDAFRHPNGLRVEVGRTDEGQYEVTQHFPTGEKKSTYDAYADAVQYAEKQPRVIPHKVRPPTYQALLEKDKRREWKIEDKEWIHARTPEDFTATGDSDNDDRCGGAPNHRGRGGSRKK